MVHRGLSDCLRLDGHGMGRLVEVKCIRDMCEGVVKAGQFAVNDDFDS